MTVAMFCYLANIFLSVGQINEISFELQMETISVLMIFTVMLFYLNRSERKPSKF